MFEPALLIHRRLGHWQPLLPVSLAALTAWLAWQQAAAGVLSGLLLTTYFALAQPMAWQRRLRPLQHQLGQLAAALGTNTQDERLLVRCREQQRIAERLRSEVQFASQALEQMAEQTEHQADAQSQRVSLIAAASEQMSQTLQHIGEHVEHAAGAFSQTHEKSERGCSDAHKLGNAITQIADSLSRTGDSVGTLLACTHTVERAVGSIQGLAKQTQLLALNASIEAARAGEQGRGFAVVADEVRQLSLATGSAAQDITEVVEAITRAVAEVHHQVEEHRHLLTRGSSQSLALADQLDLLARQSEGNLGQLASLRQALQEHGLAGQSLNQQLQQISDALQSQSGANQQLHQLTLYLTRMTQLLETAA